MSNQETNEKQQIGTIPTEEVRQSILIALESRKQEIKELNDEQLVEIAGGITRQDLTHIATVTCCAFLGAGMSAAGFYAKDHTPHSAAVGAAIGTVAGFATGIAGVMDRRTREARPGDVELGNQGHQGAQAHPIR